MLPEEDGRVGHVLEVFRVVGVGRVDSRVKLAGEGKSAGFVLRGYTKSEDKARSVNDRTKRRR